MSNEKRNFIGLLYDCPNAEIQGEQYNTKYLTGGLDLGVRVVEQVFSKPPAGWDFFRLYGMEYFKSADTNTISFAQRFMCVLIGHDNDTDNLLRLMCDAKFNLFQLGITSNYMQDIKFSDLRFISKAAWLPETLLTSRGEAPFNVSQFLRGSGTLTKEKKAVLPLRAEKSALVAQAEGFAMLRAFDSMNNGYPEQFIRQIQLFGLYKAYELAMQQATLKVSEALDEKSTCRDKACLNLVKLQRALAEFDARFYFESPVEPSRHELTKCASFFSSFSTVSSQHNDLVNQIERLGHLSHAELQVREEQRANQQDKKFKRITIFLTIIAVILTFGQVISNSPAQWWDVLVQWGEVFKNLINFFIGEE
ncbi:hypothetical protein [Desulfonatronovibrio magnus]|uniref:hypothetical protein n=1 Tax=Desulfonatronovibrio magnus TaxID=698827 RepID=UPI0005EBA9A6|nr:hypothetical protein [Desulfonatronovibrio magnus]